MTGARTLLLGLGRQGGGVPTARFLAATGVPLRIADRASAHELEASVDALADLADVDWRLGEGGADLLDDVARVVVNPGVPDRHPLLAAARARDVHVTQELNLALESYPGRVLTVTGTNGKSTTTTLLGNMLRAAGRDVLVAGNIGRSLLADREHWRADQIAVVEVSSFQLERVDVASHRVWGCVMTRVTEDHLDRHGTLAAYRAAKAVAPRLADEFVVQPSRDPVSSATAGVGARQRVLYDAAPASARCPLGRERDGWLTARLPQASGRLVHEDALELIGAFHVENVLAAAGAALLAGCDRQVVGSAAARTQPLAHRLQLLTWLRAGVALYDNAVSTELGSTASAIRALPAPVHWVGGGKSKDGNYARVANELGPLVASAHLFGDAAAPLAAAFAARGDGGPRTTAHAELGEALDAATAAARDGDAVLFSPCFASFDQFANYRERAASFHAWAGGPTRSRGGADARVGLD